MATKKDFTKADKGGYNALGALENVSKTSNASNVSNASKTSNATKTAEKRKYKRLDPREEAPEVYRITLTMPGELGRYLAAKAHAEFKDRSEIITELLEADKKAHPEILRAIDKAKKTK